MGGGGGAQESPRSYSQNFSPWKGQKKYTESLYKRAEDAYQQPWSYYPGQTYAAEDPASQEGLAARYARATGGSDAMRGANEVTAKTLAGGYINDNPYLDETYQRAADGLTESFNTAVLPRLESRFAGSNRLGSGAYGAALGRAAGQLGDSMAGMATDIYGGNYQRERDRMDSAARFAPTLAAADYDDINQLQRVGQEREGRAQQGIDDLMNRYNYTQEEPTQRLERFGNFIGSPIGGTKYSRKSGGLFSQDDQLFSNAMRFTGK